jgi:DeoR/GlpR family transcriptional regulator of sugar metabolism
MTINLSDRERRLLDILVDDPDLSVNAISQNLDVSPATIRNDLNILTEKGALVRMRGKSVPAYHPDLLARQKKNVDEKKRIARAAASLVRDGDTIIIDTGTTAAQIPRYLVGKSDVHVVTNSMMLLPYARISPGIHLTIVGGEFRPAIDCLIGKLATEGFSNFHVRLAFIGTAGFTIEGGITNMFLESAEVIREMCNVADRIILVADSTKYGQLGFAKVIPLNRVHQIVTDKRMLPKNVDELRSLGLEVTIV